MRLCEVADCKMEHHALGMCRKHHIRFKRHGSTDSKYDKDGYAALGGVKDVGPGRRGSLAVNIINDIKYKAVKRGKVWNLSHEQAFSLITKACTYCGHQPKWPENRVGIDRVFNDDGYHVDNCVPCCFTCNSAKGELSYEEFKAWIKRAYKHLHK